MTTLLQHTRIPLLALCMCFAVAAYAEHGPGAPPAHTDQRAGPGRLPDSSQNLQLTLGKEVSALAGHTRAAAPAWQASPQVNPTRAERKRSQSQLGQVLQDAARRDRNPSVRAAVDLNWRGDNTQASRESLPDRRAQDEAARAHQSPLSLSYRP